VKTLTLAVMFLLVAFTSALRPGPVLAQGEQTAAGADREPRQIDAFGRLGHCDWTARLDNFAIELQNSPAAKGYIVSYSSPEKQYFASHQSRVSRHYLVETRGLDASRIIAVDGGLRPDLKAGLTELWFVPEGAEPPVALPAADMYAPDFSGQFDTYHADLNVYQWVSEMGTPDDDVARIEFARKLKEQPASVGYFVIRTPKGSPPGAWRRLARRDEQLVSARGVEVSRLKSIDGGASQGDGAEIELWVLPLGAPPPIVEPAQTDWELSSAMKLHTYENSFGQVDEDGERWMLANLAEFLRENPRASACLIAREPKPDEEAVSDEPPSAPDSQETPAEVAASDTPAETTEESDEPEGEEDLSMGGLAEEFKERLVSEYGVAPDRVVVREGREMGFTWGRIHMWVVPEKGPWPDPSARDDDEIQTERERLGKAGDEGDAARPAAPRL
jgi:hypothetical protein